MHEQTAQIGVTAFANAQQTLLSSRAVLFGREPKRSSHLPAVSKLAGVANCRQKGRCCDRPNTAQLLQAHRHRILPGNLLDLPVEFFNTLINSEQVFPKSA